MVKSLILFVFFFVFFFFANLAFTLLHKLYLSLANFFFMFFFSFLCCFLFFLFNFLLFPHQSIPGFPTILYYWMYFIEIIVTCFNTLLFFFVKFTNFIGLFHMKLTFHVVYGSRFQYTCINIKVTSITEQGKIVLYVFIKTQLCETMNFYLLADSILHNILKLCYMKYEK